MSSENRDKLLGKFRQRSAINRRVVEQEQDRAIRVQSADLLFNLSRHIRIYVFEPYDSMAAVVRLRDVPEES